MAQATHLRLQARQHKKANMNPLRKSLSLRLLSIFILIALVTVILIAQLFSRGLGSQWKNNIQPHMVQYLSYIHNDVGSPPDHSSALALSQRLPINIYIYRGTILEYATNGESLDFQSIQFMSPPKRKRDNRPSNRKRSLAPLPPNHAFGRVKRQSYLRVMQDEHTLYYELRDRKRLGHFADNFPWALLALAGILIFSYFIIKRQLSPIQKIKHGVMHMSQGDLQHRIAVKGNDDLGQLGNSINDMAERIDNMLEAKRQLLIAISHELRSPLARSRIAVEMLPSSVNQQRISDDLTEMDKLIHEIMESERLQHHTDLHYQVVALTPLLQEVIGDQTDSIILNVSDETIELEADDARLRILFRNLINNALQHGRINDTDTVTVSAEKTSTHVTVSVADQGPGIDAQYIDQLGEPFFRPDESNSTQRHTGKGATTACSSHLMGIRYTLDIAPIC